MIFISGEETAALVEKHHQTLDIEENCPLEKVEKKDQASDHENINSQS